MINSSENRQEGQYDPMERVKEIDNKMETYKFVGGATNEKGEECLYSESVEGKALLRERAEIVEQNKDNPDFKLAYAAHQAPREGQETSDKEKNRRVEIIETEFEIMSLKERLERAENRLKKLKQE